MVSVAHQDGAPTLKGWLVCIGFVSTIPDFHVHRRWWGSARARKTPQRCVVHSACNGVASLSCALSYYMPMMCLYQGVVGMLVLSMCHLQHFRRCAPPVVLGVTERNAEYLSAPLLIQAPLIFAHGSRHALNLVSRLPALGSCACEVIPKMYAPRFQWGVAADHGTTSGRPFCGSVHVHLCMSFISIRMRICLSLAASEVAQGRPLHIGSLHL